MLFKKSMNTLGIVFVEEFATQCCIGCTEDERKSAQPILIDLRCEVDFAPAFDSDHRRDCVDYCTLRDIAEHAATGEKVYQLLESLALEISKQILQLPHIYAIDISIRKPYKLSGAKAVGISLQRSREEI